MTKIQTGQRIIRGDLLGRYIGIEGEGGLYGMKWVHKGIAGGQQGRTAEDQGEWGRPVDMVCQFKVGMKGHNFL